jgi:hypothetical protein
VRIDVSSPSWHRLDTGPARVNRPNPCKTKRTDDPRTTKIDSCRYDPQIRSDRLRRECRWPRPRFQTGHWTYPPLAPCRRIVCRLLCRSVRNGTCLGSRLAMKERKAFGESVAIFAQSKVNAECSMHIDTTPIDMVFFSPFS